MQVESSGMTDATSPVGAMGLMQVMPETYAELRQRYNLGEDPYDPHNNIMAGTAYIREMYDMFGSPGFLGAYNAGPARYGQYANAGRRLPTETARYMAILAPQVADYSPRRPGPSEGGYGMFAQGPSPAVVPAVAVTPTPVLTPAPRIMAASSPAPLPVRPVSPMPVGTTVLASGSAPGLSPVGPAPVMESDGDFDRSGLVTASFTSSPVLSRGTPSVSPTIESMIGHANAMGGQPTVSAPVMLYPAGYVGGNVGQQQWVNPDDPRS